MRRHIITAVLAIAAAAVVIIPIACGPGDDDMPPAVCGNGKQEGAEQCDLGENNGMDGYPCSSSCKAVSVIRSTLNVVWSILEHPVDGFDNSTCSKIQADKAELLIVGPDGVRITQTVECGRYSMMYTGVCVTPDGGGSPDCTRRLPLGNYQATIRLTRDSDKTAVTAAVSSPKRTNSKHGETLLLNVDFALDDLLNKGTLRGSLLLDLSWGEDKKKCDDAMPPVDQEALWLGLAGASMPLKGIKSLSGTAVDDVPSKCITPGKPMTPDQNRSTEEIANLQIGLYTLKIRGYEVGKNVPTYCKKLEVFVGPSNNNDPYRILVPAIVAGDAGVSTCN